MKKQGWHLLKRLLRYNLGLILMALGVSLSITSNLGVSPVSVIPYVVSVIFQWDLGLCTSCVLSLFVLSQYIIHRPSFQWSNCLQILGAGLFGFFLSMTNALVGQLSIEGNYPCQLLFCAMGIVLVAIGIILYMGVDLLPLPAEGVMQAFSQRFKRSLATSKIVFDCTAVAISLAISLGCMSNIIGVREGTLICALGVGLCIKGIHYGQGKFTSWLAGRL